MVSLPYPLEAPESLLQTDDRLSQIGEHELKILEIRKEDVEHVPR